MKLIININKAMSHKDGYLAYFNEKFRSLERKGALLCSFDAETAKFTESSLVINVDSSNSVHPGKVDGVMYNEIVTEVWNGIAGFIYGFLSMSTH